MYEKKTHDNELNSNVTKGRQYSAAVINLGCKVNRYEADSMRKIMADSGIALVEPDDIADFYIVNTCSVTNIAERKSRQMLRRAKRRNPEAVVIAAGCYVNAAHDELLALDYVDAVIGNDRKTEIMDVLVSYMKKDSITDTSSDDTGHDSYDSGEHSYSYEVCDEIKPDRYVRIDGSERFEEMGELSAAYLDHRRAYIKIQDGCNQFCSYCIIPYTRGRIRSRAPENIIEEITGLARSGVKEFVLTGIHISSYGKDYDEVSQGVSECDKIMDLADIICAVSDIPEVERIRLGSLEPRIITNEFLEKISKATKLCPHFHLSLQSACNETLKRMNRKYTIEEYMKSCELLRDYYDRPAITTDVIVGFPGETEEEFNTTVNNLKLLKLYEIHVFKYSVRHGTIAEKMPDQVPDQDKNTRSDILLALTAEQKKNYEESLVGLNDEVLVEEEADINKNRVKKAGDITHINTIECNNDESVGNGKKMFTGYTKRYVKVYVNSENDITGDIIPYTF